MYKQSVKDITDEIESGFYCPKAALMVYENKGGRTFLETRKIGPDGRMGAGKPVTQSFIDAMISNFSRSQSSVPHGAVPSNLLYADVREGIGTYVWWNEPRRRVLRFVPGLYMEDGEYPQPAVVYRVQNGHLSVWAFRYAGHAPTPETALYLGPFFNYSSSGSVCIGSGRVEAPSELTWDALLLGWEKVFWDSTNSHLGSNPVKGNLVTILQGCRTRSAFPFSTLTKTKLKLKDILKQ